MPFGKRVVERGLARPDQIVAALRLQAERSAKGVHHNLGQILVEQRILTPAHVRDLLAEEFYVAMACPLCGERYNVARDRTGPVTCPADGSPLSPAGGEGDIGIAATLRVETPDTPIGQELGGCRILELLGKGGMGAVYKAKHVGLNRYVAIKVLPTASQDPLIARRLLTEARAIARLEHPNIVQVYDVGSQRGFVFMVMQLLQGRTLEEQLVELGMPDLRDALGLVHDIGQGLSAAHRAGVIHRDLKPANVIVTHDGRARLTDFGLARTGGAPDELGDLVVGTPAYMAPEQWTRGAVDGRADLYSLGVIFYQLVTGRRPFEAATLEELRNLHVKSQPKAPRSINPSVTPGIQAVLSKMLAKSPERRYPDLSTFLEDLALLFQDKDPKALEETGRFLRCGFCETLNPRGATKCKVCGERIGAAAAEPLDLALREGESYCPHCHAVNAAGSRACATCRRKL